MSFCASANPFARYIAARFRNIPLLDTSGGNVSHSAISLAVHLGAEAVHLYGLDFSYPEGKAYAKGTYIYHDFELRENRHHPVESLSFSFVLRSPKTSRISTSYGLRYETPQLNSYKENLENFLDNIGIEVIPEKGKGLDIFIDGRKSYRVRDSSQSVLSTENKQTITAGDFKTELKEKIRSLPAPELSISAYLSKLDPVMRETVFLLLPLCADIREHSEEQYRLASIVEKAACWAADTIDKA